MVLGRMTATAPAPRNALLLHATCVQLGDTGVILLGPSGSGKSDLALRLIDRGAVLVADDQTQIERIDDRLVARAAPSLAGLLEVRGVGILKLPCCDASPLGLTVELHPEATLPRLPDWETHDLLGVQLPLVRLDPRAASACARIRLALAAERVA